MNSVAKRPKAYSYTRFSTPEQAKGDSARRQIALAEEYARRNELDLDTSLTLDDKGVSAFRGRNANDGRLGDFLRAVQAGIVTKGSYLLVENLDRISRQVPRKAVRTLEAIVESGITVVTMSDGKAYTEKSLDRDPFSFVMAVLAFVRANEESETKGRRVRAAWANKRERAIADGTPMTKRTPGWLILGANGKLRLDVKKAALVRRIFKMTLAGAGQHAIAEAFNREKVKAFSADRWHRSYVKKLLDNPAVIGRLIAHTMEYEDGRKVRKPVAQADNHFPAAVTMDDWNRVQAMRDTGASGSRSRAAPSGTAPLQNILASLARCPLCAGTMTRVSKGPTGATAYLTCAKKKAGAGCNASLNAPMAPIEISIVGHLSEVLGTMPSGDDEVDRKLVAVEDGLQVAIEQAARITDAIAQRGVTGALGDRLRDIEAAIAEGEAKKAALEARIQDAPLLGMKVAELADEIEKRKPDRQRINGLLRQMARAVVVDVKRGRLVFQWKHGGESEMIFAWVGGKGERGDYGWERKAR